MRNQIYFDHNATTPLHPKALELLPKIMVEGFGNASSIHWAGRKPKQILRETRQKLAQYLGCHPTELIFTSGASESNSTVIHSVLDLKQIHPKLKSRNTIVTSNIEHPSVQATVRHYQELGLVRWVTFDITRTGEINLDQFRSLLTSEVLLVSIMGANNETGIVLPVAELAALAKEQEILFHSDMTQVFGKFPIDLSHLDYISFSAHKAYALKGCGVLWVRKGVPFEPLIRGGSQERYRRSGTENVLSIASLGIVVEAFDAHGGYTGSLLKPLQQYFESQIKKTISGVSITHENMQRLPNTTHLIIEGVDGESLLMNLDLRGYAVSTGAACSSGSPEPSPILINMGFTRQQAQMSLRVSFGISNTIEEIDRFLIDLSEVVTHLRNIQGASCEF